MGIKFRCATCRHKLNVKAFLAGKRGVCPYCGSSVDIPLESKYPDRKSGYQSGDRTTRLSAQPSPTPTSASHPFNGDPIGAPSRHRSRSDSYMIGIPTGGAYATGESSARPDHPAGHPFPAELDPATSAPATEAVDPIVEAPDAVWYVRPPSGGQFGPARGEVMRKWLSEGRVSNDSLVWREGWIDWQLAGPVFPSLLRPENGTAGTGDATSPSHQTAGAGITAAGRHPTRRRKSNSLAATMTVMLVVLAGIALGVLVWVLQH